MFLLLMTGCVDSGQPPSECAPDLSLVGFPGVADDNHSYLVSGGDVVDLCVRLDSSRNTRDVEFGAALAFQPFPITLHALDGSTLASGQGALELAMPAGEVWFARLSFTVPQRIATTTALLQLDFSQTPSD